MMHTKWERSTTLAFNTQYITTVLRKRTVWDLQKISKQIFFVLFLNIVNDEKCLAQYKIMLCATNNNGSISAQFVLKCTN